MDLHKSLGKTLCYVYDNSIAYIITLGKNREIVIDFINRHVYNVFIKFKKELIDHYIYQLNTSINATQLM